MQKLTAPEQEVFDALEGFIKKHNRIPSYSELGDSIGKSKSRIAQVVALLAAKGYIKVEPGISKSIQIIHKNEK